MSGEYTLWPGSRQAIQEGCVCPVLDNGHGNASFARDRGGFLMFADCPVHGLGCETPPVPPAETADRRSAA